MIVNTSFDHLKIWPREGNAAGTNVRLHFELLLPNYNHSTVTAIEHRRHIRDDRQTFVRGDGVHWHRAIWTGRHSFLHFYWRVRWFCKHVFSLFVRSGVLFVLGRNALCCQLIISYLSVGTLFDEFSDLAGSCATNAIRNNTENRKLNMHNLVDAFVFLDMDYLRIFLRARRHVFQA